MFYYTANCFLLMWTEITCEFSNAIPSILVGPELNCLYNSGRIPLLKHVHTLAVLINKRFGLTFLCFFLLSGMLSTEQNDKNKKH